MNYRPEQGKSRLTHSSATGIPWLRSLLYILMVAVSLPVMVGCNTSAIYQDDRYNPPVYWGRHVVKKGETLYSIAWRYGRDYRELGNANNIQPPYHIRAGQVLRLDLKGRVPASTRTASTADPRAASSGGTASQDRSARSTAPAKTDPKPQVTRKPDRGVELARQSQTVSDISWQWPHTGTVIANFSTSGQVNKGIDIAGNAGDPIRAAADGNVVYAGNGLLGYGNLIIVNHNEHFLSAYAHNRRILVKEGEDVKQGQTIAEMGDSGAEGNKLHFEIRRNGNPVDPMPYLPAR